MLYDLQFPSDDGSCPQYVDESSCLHRTSILDPSQSYCQWTPLVIASAGVIVESSSGSIVQTISLTPDATDDQLHSQCAYVAVNPSETAQIAAAVVTSIFSTIVMRFLSVLVALLNAPTIEETKKFQQLKSVQKQMKHSVRLFRRGNQVQDDSMELALPSPTAGRRSAVVVPLRLSPKHCDTPAKSAKFSFADEHGHESKRDDVALRYHEGPSFSSPNSNAGNVNGDEGAGQRRKAEVVEAQERSPSTTCLSFFLYLLGKVVPLKVATGNDNIIRLVSEDVRRARERFLDLFHWNYPDVSIVVPAASSLQSMSQRTHMHRRMAISLKTAAVDTATLVALDKMRHHLQMATELEYAVNLLHTLMDDLLGPNSTTNKLFFMTLAKDFEEEMPAVSANTQYFAGTCIALANVGALFMVALKGISRGSDWQHNFLVACFIQWVLDAIFLLPLEVLWIDFGLPGLIYRDVVVRGIFPLFQIADDFLIEAKQLSSRGASEGKGTGKIQHSGRRNRSIHNHSNHNNNFSSSGNSYSQKHVDSASFGEPDNSVMGMLAKDRAKLVESQLIFLRSKLKSRQQLTRRQQEAGSILDPGSPPDSSATVGRNAPLSTSDGWYDRLIKWLIRMLISFPLDLQRIGLRFSASFALAGVLLAWLALESSSGGRAAAAGFVLGVIIFTGAAVVSSYFQQKLPGVHKIRDESFILSAMVPKHPKVPSASSSPKAGLFTRSSASMLLARLWSFKSLESLSSSELASDFAFDSSLSSLTESFEGVDDDNRIHGNYRHNNHAYGDVNNSGYVSFTSSVLEETHSTTSSELLVPFALHHDQTNELKQEDVDEDVDEDDDAEEDGDADGEEVRYVTMGLRDDTEDGELSDMEEAADGPRDDYAHEEYPVMVALSTESWSSASSSAVDIEVGFSSRQRRRHSVNGEALTRLNQRADEMTLSKSSESFMSSSVSWSRDSPSGTTVSLRSSGRPPSHVSREAESEDCVEELLLRTNSDDADADLDLKHSASDDLGDEQIVYKSDEDEEDVLHRPRHSSASYRGDISAASNSLFEDVAFQPAMTTTPEIISEERTESNEEAEEENEEEGADDLSVSCSSLDAMGVSGSTVASSGSFTKHT